MIALYRKLIERSLWRQQLKNSKFRKSYFWNGPISTSFSIFIFVFSNEWTENIFLCLMTGFKPSSSVARSDCFASCATFTATPLLEHIYFPASYNQFQDTLKTFLVRALLLALYRVWDDPKLWDICCLKLARFIFKNRSLFQYCFKICHDGITYKYLSSQLFPTLQCTS